MDNTKQHKILIVEDELSLSELLGDKLSSEGFAVIVAHDGEQGVTMALKQQPDLILLDILLPKKDGLTVLKELRATPEGKNIPVMMMTNLSDTQNINDALSSGAYDYLVKSDWDLPSLVTNIRAKLGPIPPPTP